MPNKFKAKSKFKKDKADKFDVNSTSSETALEEDIDGNVVDVDPNTKGDSGSKVSRDKVQGASSTSYLKTTTEYGADVGTSFYTSVNVSNKVGDPLIDFYKSTTSFIRDKDNTTNKYARDYDSLRRYTQVSAIYAIDSPLREVTTDPTTVIYNNVDIRKPSNKVSNKSNPEYCEHISAKAGVRSLTLNLDGGMIRGNVTATSDTNGDTIEPSILDKYNDTLRKGTINVVADSIVASNVNDIGIVATTPTLWPVYANSTAYHTTTFAKANYVSGQYDKIGFNKNIPLENYVTDNIINMTNAHEKIFADIQQYNIDNNSILRAISDQATLNIALNSVVPFTTFMMIYYKAMSKAVKHQIRMSSVVGAVNSTFANIAQGKKFDLEAKVNSLEKLRKSLKDLPYNPQVVAEFEKTCDPFKLLETSSNAIDNCVLFPTYKLVTNNVYNYSKTNLSDKRNPDLFPNNKGTTENTGWSGNMATAVNSTDRRFLVAFRQTVSAVAENVPQGSFLDAWNNVFNASQYTSDWVPFKQYKDFSFENLNFKGNSSIAKLLEVVAAKFKANSDTPNISEEAFTSYQLGMTENEVSDISVLRKLSENTDTVGLHPIVSAGLMTAYMRAMLLFINREKTFIDNFCASLERVKLFFKTINEKIGYQGFYDTITEDNIPKVNFDNYLCDEFEYNADKVRDFFSTPFQVDMNWSGSSVVNAYPIYSGAAFNEGTADNPQYSPSINRVHLYIKKDGSSYTDPLYSRTRWVVYGNGKDQRGFNPSTDTICYNNDILALDLYQGQQYIGEHIFSFYNGNTNSSFFIGDSNNSACISYGWGNYNFYYGMGKTPERPRYQQRSLCINTTTDGLFQSPIFSAFENPYETVIKDVYSKLTSLIKSPVIGNMAQSKELYDNPMEYLISYIRNTTGLAVGETLRRHLIDSTYRYGKEFKLINKNYIGF